MTYIVHLSSRDEIMSLFCRFSALWSKIFVSKVEIKSLSQFSTHYWSIKVVDALKDCFLWSDPVNISCVITFSLAWREMGLDQIFQVSLWSLKWAGCIILLICDFFTGVLIVCICTAGVIIIMKTEITMIFTIIIFVIIITSSLSSSSSSSHCHHHHHHHHQTFF